MITIRLAGGCGNQLFQWALGRALEHRGHEVQFDTSILDGNQARRVLLSDLGIALKTIQAPPSSQWLNEVSLRFFSAVFQMRGYGGDWGLDGYWQSEKYFADIADKLRQEVFANLTVSIETSEEAIPIIHKEDSCFLHIRRSDNLRPTSTLYHGLTDAKRAPYYKRAIEIMRTRFPSVTFYVFSDDPEWIRANMTDSDMVCVTHNTPSFTVDETHNLHKTSDGREVEDLYLMSLCRHAIIANSTFSWWGAWLNREQDGLVIAPDPWFSGETNLDATDIIPARWMKVSTL